MATKATVYKKIGSSVWYGPKPLPKFDLTLALHLLKTEERMMVRLARRLLLLADEKEGGEQLGFSKE